MTRVKAGRNDSCPCGSGKKYKRCCEANQQKTRGSMAMALMVAAVLAGAIFVGIASFSDEAAPVARPGGTWSPEHGHYH